MKRMQFFASIMLAATILTGCGKAKVPAPPATPDKAIEAAAAAIVDNQPDAIFAIMPKSYQNDINTLTKEFAEKMDTDVWNGVRDRLGRISGILKDKGDLIADSMAEMQRLPDEEKAKMKKTLQSAANTLKTLSSSVFTDLDALKKGDLFPLLQTEGREIMKGLEQIALNAEAGDDNPWKAMQGVTVALVNQEGDSATLKITANGETEEVEMTKVEDAWVPADMASEWNDMVQQARDNIAKIDMTTEENKAMKTQIMAMMSGVDSMLTQLESAEDKETIQGVINGMMGMLMGQMTGGGM